MAKAIYQGSGDIIQMTANKDYAAGDYFRLPEMKCAGVVVADAKKGESVLVRIRGAVEITNSFFTFNVGKPIGLTADGFETDSVSGGSGEVFLGWALTAIPQKGSGLVLLGGPQL